MDFREFDMDDIMKDPDKRAKLFLLISYILIAIPIVIGIGLILYMLIQLGIL
ncbi:MAG: hypothetical protein HVN34_10545 [Methanobacteriaceae archaeon]|jgi:hypothetical protein|nr:hypothetical protein [Methanobacteriaceae archaeon]OPY19854.1 MAG: hypothetical protein A4E26_02110 [Methanobacterium sp. PtaU1.Bin097]